MKLMKSDASPFVRSVMVALHETGLLPEVELIDVATTPLESNSSLITANPLGKIPALLRSEGPAIYDSRVICRYLDDRAGSGLYPETRLWDTLTLEATAHGIMDAAVLITYELRFRPPEMVFHDWVEGQWSKISRALDALETRWLGHLQGPLDMGHIAVGSALGYLDLRHDVRSWRTGRDGLAGWYADFAQRESMKATAPA